MQRVCVWLHSRDQKVWEARQKGKIQRTKLVPTQPLRQGVDYPFSLVMRENACRGESRTQT